MSADQDLRTRLHEDLRKAEEALDRHLSETTYFLKGLGFGLSIGLVAALAFGWRPWA